MNQETRTALTRRRVLGGTAAALAPAIAGCSGGGTDDQPGPITLAGAGSCDQCGMVIDRQPGPVGQTYYRDHEPEGHDSPAHFCSTVCTYRYQFAATDRGWTPQATYLTDYATVDYTVRQAGDGHVISAHLDADAFGAAETLRVVVGADVEGAMGPALVPFGDGADASSFAAEYGGEVIDAADISRELVARG